MPTYRFHYVITRSGYVDLTAPDAATAQDDFDSLSYDELDRAAIGLDVDVEDLEDLDNPDEAEE